MKKPGERAHSKFSASGAERWTECSASVEASEGQPDKETEWSKEGTLAHSVLEKILLGFIEGRHVSRQDFYYDKNIDGPMYNHAMSAAKFIWSLGKKLDAEVMVETRIYLKFIHPEMFGTFDGAVLDHFGTLHVFDFKYGAGHSVGARSNMQMAFYAVGLAHKYKWNFERVRLWIIQPRIKGYDGPTFWDISIEELRKYVPVFTDAVWRVENEPEFKEGNWCHWCKAKSVCPIKKEAKLKSAVDLFSNNPINKSTKGQLNGLKKESESFKEKSSKDRKKEIEKQRRLAKKGWGKKEETESDGDFY